VLRYSDPDGPDTLHPLGPLSESGDRAPVEATVGRLMEEQRHNPDHTPPAIQLETIAQGAP
jgi:hypothetical protein